jgi:hypothetical protein
LRHGESPGSSFEFLAIPSIASNTVAGGTDLSPSKIITVFQVADEIFEVQRHSVLITLGIGYQSLLHTRSNSTPDIRASPFDFIF